MSSVARILQIAALLALVAVLIILLTPADDGPVLSVCRGAANLLMFLGLVVFTSVVRGVFFPQFRRVESLPVERAAPAIVRVASAATPLIC